MGCSKIGVKTKDLLKIPTHEVAILTPELNKKISKYKLISYYSNLLSFNNFPICHKIHEKSEKC